MGKTTHGARLFASQVESHAQIALDGHFKTNVNPECAGLPEEALEEEVTHGRNVQVKIHIPRHSVEARRSCGFADR